MTRILVPATLLLGLGAVAPLGHRHGAQEETRMPQALAALEAAEDRHAAERAERLREIAQMCAAYCDWAEVAQERVQGMEDLCAGRR